MLNVSKTQSKIISKVLFIVAPSGWILRRTCLIYRLLLWADSTDCIVNEEMEGEFQIWARSPMVFSGLELLIWSYGPAARIKNSLIPRENSWNQNCNWLFIKYTPVNDRIIYVTRILPMNKENCQISRMSFIICPSCDMTIKHFASILKIVRISAIIALMIIAGQIPVGADTNNNNQEKERAGNKVALQDSELKWNYEEIQDEMGRGNTKIAFVKSLNKVEFDFPYQGAQRATLMLRIHPEYGNDVILSIKQGQFLCNFDGCTVNVRFGEGEPVKYTASGPSDQSATLLFINNYKDFLANIKKVNRVSIEAQFFQEGNRVFHFDVSGLKWP